MSLRQGVKKNWQIRSSVVCNQAGQESKYDPSEVILINGNHHVCPGRTRGRNSLNESRASAGGELPYLMSSKVHTPSCASLKLPSNRQQRTPWTRFHRANRRTGRVKHPFYHWAFHGGIAQYDELESVAGDERDVIAGGHDESFFKASQNWTGKRFVKIQKRENKKGRFFRWMIFSRQASCELIAESSSVWR
jgi:hypothetical protein